MSGFGPVSAPTPTQVAAAVSSEATLRAAADALKQDAATASTDAERDAAAIQAVHGSPVPNAKRPNQNLATYLAGAVPLWLAISETDTIGDATLAHAFAAAVGAQSVSLGAVGHNYLGLDTAAATTFLAAHL